MIFRMTHLQVEAAIAAGRDGPDVIKLDSSDVSKYYVGRIVDSMNDSGMAVVVAIETKDGSNNSEGAEHIL